MDIIWSMLFFLCQSFQHLMSIYRRLVVKPTVAWIATGQKRNVNAREAITLSASSLNWKIVYKRYAVPNLTLPNHLVETRLLNKALKLRTIKFFFFFFFWNIDELNFPCCLQRYLVQLVQSRCIHLESRWASKHLFSSKRLRYHQQSPVQCCCFKMTLKP